MNNVGLQDLTPALLVIMILTDLALLGGRRLNALIRTAAGQGLLLGVLPFSIHAGRMSLRIGCLAVAAGILKGVVFPILLGRALREANVRREEDPFVGFNFSVAAGVAALAGSFWLAGGLRVSEGGLSRLTLPVAFFTIATGLFLIISRRTALAQVLGYLIMENGIYLLGTALVGETPLLVELGVLLDAFVAVFVMGIAVCRIHRAFDHMDAARLDQLRD